MAIGENIRHTNKFQMLFLLFVIVYIVTFLFLTEIILQLIYWTLPTCIGDEKSSWI